ncbi:hypothetical protein [Nitrospira sp. BLG_2]|uniref:hypothetical protein n=1 Tax=Nitrospira sp. BLG_2 TaxID=3397507 RepID=UPI003B9D579A
MNLEQKKKIIFDNLKMEFDLFIEQNGYKLVGSNDNVSDYHTLIVYTNADKVLITTETFKAPYWEGIQEYDKKTFRKLCDLGEDDEITADALGYGFIMRFSKDLDIVV